MALERKRQFLNKFKLVSKRKKRLITQISDPAFLKHAWFKLNKSNKDSRGISEETISDFSNNLDSNLHEISKTLKNKSYIFNKVRPVLIPKNEKNKFRPLRLSDIRDRVVQKALAIKLNELLSDKYQLHNRCSFAYIKNGRVSDAIRKMVEYYNEGYKIILEADIKKFFDQVNRDKLIKQIANDLEDRTINKLIKNALEQKTGDLSSYEQQHHHYFLDSIQGIPQGNPLSPLLANIYLSAFDQRMIAEGIKLIRFADDFIIMCKTIKEAKLALSIAKQEIEDKLGLELHPLPIPSYLVTSKTRIVDPKQHDFSFLSIRFDGEKVWVKSDKVMDLRTRINTITDLKTYRNDPKYDGLITILQRLKNLLEGWLSAFKYVDVDRYFDEIDEHINYKLYTLLLKLDFKLKSTSVETKRIKSTGRIVQLITSAQRDNIGVLRCEKFLKGIDRELI